MQGFNFILLKNIKTKIFLTKKMLQNVSKISDYEQCFNIFSSISKCRNEFAQIVFCDIHIRDYV